MMKILKIISITFISILIIFIGVILFYKCKNTSEDEIFILTDNFIGSVIVLYNAPDGENEKYSSTKRMYNIPRDGILKTKFNLQEGYRHITYVTTNGRDLRYLWPSDVVWTDTANINSIYRDSIYVTHATSRGDFIVGKTSQFDSLVIVLEKRWGKISKKEIFREGDSTSNFRHNKLLDNIK